MITTLTALIKNRVLMMFLLRADLSVLLRIGETKAFYFFRAGPVHGYLHTAFSPALPECAETRTFPSARSTIHQWDAYGLRALYRRSEASAEVSPGRKAGTDQSLTVARP